MTGANEPDELLVERDGAALWLRFNRPRARNAMNWPIRHALLDALATAAGDPGIRVVILCGDERAFCAGADVNEMVGDYDADAMLDAGGEIVRRIAALDKPVVAAVQGHAAGAGMSLALACDIIVMAGTATFTSSFVRMGLAPDLAASFWLPRQLGVHRAKKLLFSESPLSAAEALESGLASHVWPDDRFEAELVGLVGVLATGATRAYGAAKRLVNASLEVSLDGQLAHEHRLQTDLVRSADHAEAVEAFRGKRSPRFTGG